MIRDVQQQNRVGTRFHRERLNGLPLGPVRYFDSIGSTNDEAARWAGEGAPDLALVIADEQRAGKGRLGRRWLSPSGAGLAFSLVLRPESMTLQGVSLMPRLSGLGALSVVSGLQAACGLQAEIKWPNDVLLQQRKMSGILAEAQWQAERLTALVLGIGVNISPASVPQDDDLSFPATCVEHELGKPVDRWDLLRAILESLLYWRERLASTEFLAAWEAQLAYRGEAVFVSNGSEEICAGEVLGLTSRGELRLCLPDGEERNFIFGELTLRLVDSPMESNKLSGDEREL